MFTSHECAHTCLPTSLESRTCETPPPSLEHLSLSKSQPSRQGPAEDISPASPGSQAAEIDESYPLGTQAAGIKELGARVVKSRNLIISFSFKGMALICHRLPQRFSGRRASGPRIQQISFNWWSCLHRSARQVIWAPSGPQVAPRGPSEPTAFKMRAKVMPTQTKRYPW